MRTSCFIGLGALACGLAFGGCAGGLKLRGSWVRPDYEPRALRKIAVVAVSEDRVGRAEFEEYFVNELEGHGINAVAGQSVLPPDLPVGIRRITDEERALVEQKFKEQEIDAAITLRLVGLDTKETSISAVIRPTPVEQGMGFYGYYPGIYQPTLKPGGTGVSRTFVIESRLYLLDREGLMWKAQVVAKDPPRLPTSAIEFAKLVVDDLIERRVLLCKRSCGRS